MQAMTEDDLFETWISPEQIYRDTPTQKAVRHQERRRLYIENAPEELREERADLYDLNLRSTEAVEHHGQLAYRLQKLLSDPDSSSERVATLKDRATAALSECERLDAEMKFARSRYLERHREWEVKRFPSEKRARALELLEARDQAILDLPFDGQAGKMGGLAGRQFRLFRELDSAQAMGRSDEIARLQAELQATKDAYASVCRQVYQVDQRKAIRDECAANLADLTRW